MMISGNAHLEAKTGVSCAEDEKQGEQFNRVHVNQTLTGVAIGLAVLFWIIESAIHVLVFCDGNFVQQVFSPEAHEAWMRSAVVCILVAFGIYSQRIVTARSRAEEQVKSVHGELTQIFETAADGMRVIDKDFNVLRVNETFENMSGVARNEAIGKKCYEVFPGLLCHTSGCPLNRILNGEERVTCDTQKVNKDGIEVHCCVTARPFRKHSGQLIGIVEDFNDITERQRTEKALRESREIYRSLVEHIELGITLIDPDLNIVTTNQAQGKLFDKPASAFLGKKCFREFEKRDVICPHCPGVQAMAAGEPVEVETQGVRDNGSRFWVKIYAFPAFGRDGTVTGFIEIVEDISEKRKLEAQLRQAQKMEAIGTLAGGIAHDFNNILAAIIGYTDLVMEDVPQGSTAKANLEEIFKAGIRAKDLVGQILAFSRQGEQEQKPFQVTLIIKEALKLLRASLPITMEIRQNIEGPSSTILADPTQIHQVLMNLCTNAAHAIQEKGGPGVLEVTLKDVDLDADAAARHPDLKPGPYVRLAVSDTGCGMDHTVLERIFDPFFTTKAVGKGTGMGLSVVHGIVKSHGGAIMADSKPGRGTTFHVFFPRIETKEAQHGAVGPVPTGNERILFVDDEKALAAVGKKSLEHLGYEVVAKTSSIEALEAFRAQPDKFDLVITDLTIPNMTGTELQRELVAIRQDIPVILCTGYEYKISREQAKSMGIEEVVTKPFARNDIARTIRRVLDKDNRGQVSTFNI